MDWQEESATEQQLLRLQSYGFVPTSTLTVTQAARLIRQYSKRRPPAAAPPAVLATTAPQPAQVAPLRPQPAQAARLRPQLAREDIRAVLQEATQKLSETARRHAYQLRLEVLEAEQTLRENPEGLGVRADVHSAIAVRQQFWFDTCRDAKDLQSASAHALEFYQHFGAGFFSPTWGEVHEVLDALDRAMPGWDKDHPELFYETLKLNFPSLLRHR